MTPYVFPFIVLPAAHGYGLIFPRFMLICVEPDGTIEVTEEFLRCVTHSVHA